VDCSTILEAPVDHRKLVTKMALGVALDRESNVVTLFRKPHASHEFSRRESHAYLLAFVGTIRASVI